MSFSATVRCSAIEFWGSVVGSKKVRLYRCYLIISTSVISDKFSLVRHVNEASLIA